MLTRIRIGLHVPTTEPFWVQVREAIYARCQLYPIDIISFDREQLEQLPPEAQQDIINQFFHLKLDALIISERFDRLLQPFLTNNIPIIALTEANWSDLHVTCPHSLYDSAYKLGAYIIERMGGNGTIVLLGGRRPEDLDAYTYGDESRIRGFYDIFEQYPHIQIKHIPTSWNAEESIAEIREALHEYGQPLDALIGLSDPIALVGRKICRSMGLIDTHTLIAGINGDPLALSEIIAGRMYATIAISTEVLGETGVDLAYQAALGESVPPVFKYRQQLVTSDNALQFAAERLMALAELPSRLIGSRRQEERQRLAQYGTSLAINQQVGVLLHRQQLAETAVNLIHKNYATDHVSLWIWQEEIQRFKLESATQTSLRGRALVLARTDVLTRVLEAGQIEFVSEEEARQVFAEENGSGDNHVHVLVPIRFAGATIGLLDLLHTHSFMYSLIDLEGLQIIGDQLGIAIRNAQLYEEAVAARLLAEQTDRLKTRLLANVSHELRTPLLIILGYAELVLSTPDAYGIELPDALIDDLQHIYQSGQHLVQLSDDLLDLSRDEIGTLDLKLEMLEPDVFLAEVFVRVIEGLGKSSSITWHMDMPQHLPQIYADQLRLRQIILNLLSNAVKYAPNSHVTLGAEVAPACLHLWIKDTGPGIPIEMQESIFEPFFTGKRHPDSPNGVGLGLTIARRLTMLHHGKLILESEVGRGSTFHIYLPLPD